MLLSSIVVTWFVGIVCLSETALPSMLLVQPAAPQSRSLLLTLQSQVVSVTRDWALIWQLGTCVVSQNRVWVSNHVVVTMGCNRPIEGKYPV